MSNIVDIAGFIAKNGLPVLAAGETMGKVAADFVDILVNDLFMPGLYLISISLAGKNKYAVDKVESMFKSVKKDIDVVYVVAGFLKFIFAVVAVYIVLGIILRNIGGLSHVKTSTQ